MRLRLLTLIGREVRGFPLTPQALDRFCSGDHRFLLASMRTGRPSLLLTTPLRNPRTEWAAHPVIAWISLVVAPCGAQSKPRSWLPCFPGPLWTEPRPRPNRRTDREFGMISDGVGVSARGMESPSELSLRGPRQSLLYPPGEFVLSKWVDKCILPGHAQIRMAGDSTCFDGTATHLLAPRDVGSPEGMWPQPGKITSDLLGGLMKSIPYAGVPERLPSGPPLLEDEGFRCGPVTDRLFAVPRVSIPMPSVLRLPSVLIVRSRKSADPQREPQRSAAQSAGGAVAHRVQGGEKDPTRQLVAEALRLERHVYFDLKAGRKVSEETYLKAAHHLGCSPDDLRP